MSPLGQFDLAQSTFPIQALGAQAMVPPVANNMVTTPVASMANNVLPAALQFLVPPSAYTPALPFPMLQIPPMPSPSQDAPQYSPSQYSPASTVAATLLSPPGSLLSTVQSAAPTPPGEGPQRTPVGISLSPFPSIANMSTIQTPKTEESMSRRGSGENKGKQKAHKVLAVLGLAVDADPASVDAIIESNFPGVKVLHRLSVWNKGTVLVELSSPVTLKSQRVTLGGGLYVMASPKPAVLLPEPAEVLNVRFYVMEPGEDFDASTTQRDAYAEMSQWWRKGDTATSDETLCLLSEVVTSLTPTPWDAYLTPIKPFCFSPHASLRRRYVQVFYEFDSAAQAAKAAADLEGKVLPLGELRIVIHVEYAFKDGLASAPRTAKGSKQCDEAKLPWWLQSKAEEEEDCMPQLLNDEL